MPGNTSTTSQHRLGIPKLCGQDTGSGYLIMSIYTRELDMNGKVKQHNRTCTHFISRLFLSECHSSMLNITARLAIRFRHLPDWEVDWSDRSPQRSRQSLGVSDILPSDDDAAQLQQRATSYMMNFLVREFKDLARLRVYAPEEVPLHPVEKSEVVPMKVLFKDEKYTSETIDILTQLAEDAALTGDSQVYTRTDMPISSQLKHTFIDGSG